MTVIKLSDYRNRNLTLRYDNIIADASYVLECSALLVLAACEIQVRMFESVTGRSMSAYSNRYVPPLSPDSRK